MSNEPSSDHGERVMQAADMVRAQAECTTEEAFVLMHERATMSRTSMEQVIAAVVDGSIRFDD